MLKRVVHIDICPQSHYTEGPVIDHWGNVYFTTLTGGIIFRLNPENQFAPWAQSPCPNGQIVLPNGQHVVCDSTLSALLRFDDEGTFLKKDIDHFCANEQVSVPNDLIADRNGNIYFTDSVRYNGKLFFIGNNGQQKILATELDYPNGLAFSKDEKTLYVAESYKNRILAFDIDQPGRASNQQVWTHLPQHNSTEITDNLPDGMKVDDDNCLWIAHYGMSMVHQFSEKRQLIQSIDLPFKLVSNLFIKNNTLLVTGGYKEPGPGAVVKIELANE
jgi:gluconolactonase